MVINLFSSTRTNKTKIVHIINIIRKLVGYGVDGIGHHLTHCPSGNIKSNMMIWKFCLYNDSQVFLWIFWSSVFSDIGFTCFHLLCAIVFCFNAISKASLLLWHLSSSVSCDVSDCYGFLKFSCIYFISTKQLHVCLPISMS